MPPKWIVGVLVCLFGSTCTAMGLVLQKYSMPADDGERSPSNFSYCRQPWWIAGFSLWLAAQFINFIAMALAPQAVLSTLGSWSLACNIVFARWILKEVMGMRKLICVCGLVFAVTLVILGAPAPSEDEEDVVDVRVVSEGFVRWDFDLLASFLVCSVFILHGTRKACGPPNVEEASFHRQDSATSNGSGRKMSAKEMVVLASHAMNPAAWAATAAVASGFTALFFKCIAEVLAATGQEPWWRCWQTYAILAGGVCCAPAEIHMLNLALQAGEAVVVVPAYFALGMLAQLSIGSVFFQEYKDFQTNTQLLTFLVGVISALLFVALINLDNQRAEQAEAKLPQAKPDVQQQNSEPSPDQRTTHRTRSTTSLGTLKPEALQEILERGPSLENENALTQWLLKQ